jgi:hypothetical protein
MPRALPIGWLLPALLGCNSLTGVNDLEPVDCVDCVDSALVADTAVDSARRDTAIDTAIDTDTAVADTSTGCITDDECADESPCTTDRCSPAMRMCAHDPIDGDGDGESASSLGACGLDCNDANKDVFSTQTMFFTTAYPGTTTPVSFDYNCDGKNEQQSTTLVRCMNVDTVCTLINEGWVSTVPACGVTGKYATSCRRVLTSGCIPVSADKVQACR